MVSLGCGTVVGSTSLTGALGLKGSALAISSIVIAVAFGMSVVIAAYSVGNVSGAHLNSAISFGMFLDGRLSLTDFIGYVVAQFLGSITAAGMLAVFTGSTKSLGANGYGDASALGTGMGTAFFVETVLTFFFVLVVLGVTSKPEYSNIAGLVIGIALAGVVLLGLPFTGSSVNPARSFGPALLTGGEALSQVWLFIVAPLVGSAIAAVVHRFVLAPGYLKQD